MIKLIKSNSNNKQHNQKIKKINKLLNTILKNIKYNNYLKKNFKGGKCVPIIINISQSNESIPTPNQKPNTNTKPNEKKLLIKYTYNRKAPPGLYNYGVTCYANAVLQVFIRIPHVEEILLSNNTHSDYTNNCEYCNGNIDCPIDIIRKLMYNIYNTKEKYIPYNNSALIFNT